MNRFYGFEVLAGIGVLIAMFWVSYTDLAKQFGYWGFVGMLVCAVLYMRTQSRMGAIVWTTATMLATGAAGGWLYH